MKPRRALVFLNRRASRADRSGEDALTHLRDGGIALVEADPCDAPGMSVAIRRAAAEFDAVIVGGGDGTLNAAADGVAATGIPLGILPLGTANDLARTLGLPADPVAAAAVIASGTTRRIDLGEVNGHPFFNVASLGLSVAVAEELTTDLKRRWGVLGYAITATRVMRRSRPFFVTIEHDGLVERARTLQVAVGNGRFYGGGLAIADDATADDGRLDLYSLEVRGWLGLVALAPWLRRGTHGRWRKVRAFGATDLTIRTRRPRDINADGELVTQTPARFRVRPGAVTVFAPPPNGPPAGQR